MGLQQQGTLFDWKTIRRKARDDLNNAIKAGKVERGSQCMICGLSSKCEAHHFCYTTPLDVSWLCPSCHVIADKQKGFREGRITVKPLLDWDHASKESMK